MHCIILMWVSHLECDSIHMEDAGNYYIAPVKDGWFIHFVYFVKT